MAESKSTELDEEMKHLANNLRLLLLYMFVASPS